MENKRRFTRVPFRMKTRVTIGGVIFNADEICNLSIGGCLLPFDVPYPLGTSCHIEILLNQEDPSLCVDVEGEIVRKKSEVTAIRFTRIDPDSLFHLRNIVRYNSPDPDAVEDEIEKHPGLI